MIGCKYNSLKSILILMAGFFIYFGNSACAVARTPLTLEHAKSHFDEPFMIFARSWMDETGRQKIGGIAYRVARFKPKYDARYRLKRVFYPSDEGILKNAAIVFSNYCIHNQGALIPSFRGHLFCVKNGFAFAQVSWITDQVGDQFEGLSNQLSTTFIMQSDEYANNDYRKLMQYKPANIVNFVE